MSSFPKILRETRLDEDKVILNRSCYAFRFIPRLLLRSPAFNLWLLQWTSPPRCQQPKKPTSIQEAATSVGQNNWWSQHGDNRFMRFQRQISHTLRSSWWNCQLNHSKIWSLNISLPSYSHPFFKDASCTVFENHRKSLIQPCERSELRLHFEGTKVH